MEHHHECKLQLYYCFLVGKSGGKESAGGKKQKKQEKQEEKQEKKEKKEKKEVEVEEVDPTDEILAAEPKSKDPFEKFPKG